MSRGIAILARVVCRFRGHRWVPVVYSHVQGGSRRHVCECCSRCDVQRSRRCSEEEYAAALSTKTFVL